MWRTAVVVCGSIASAGFAVLAACGGPSRASSRGGDDGTAAQIICAAECRHELRCNANDPACPGRCATLPVRHPAVWSAAWADDIARCFATASCDHDADERCVFATSRHTAAADACYASASSRRQFCPVMNGLSDAAAETARACFAGGGDDCMPPLDWK